MRLALEAAVRQDLGLGTSADYIAAVQTALDASTMALEADLRTSFDRGTYTDDFIATPGTPFYKLKLKQGFVLPGSVSISYAPSYQGWNQTPPLDITSICQVDYERGIVSVTGYMEGYRGLPERLVRVSYTAGFDTDPFSPLLYRQDQVPLWLNELAKMKARIAMAGHPALDATGVTFDVKTSRLPDLYLTAIMRHSRYCCDAVYAR